MDNFKCQKCGNCCGMIPFTSVFLRRFKRYHQAKGKWIEHKGLATIETQDGFCVFLNRITKLCAIYKYRPTVCRLMGTVPELGCEKNNQNMMARDEMIERWLKQPKPLDPDGFLKNFIK